MPVDREVHDESRMPLLELIGAVMLQREVGSEVANKDAGIVDYLIHLEHHQIHGGVEPSPLYQQSSLHALNNNDWSSAAEA